MDKVAAKNKKLRAGKKPEDPIIMQDPIEEITKESDAADDEEIKQMITWGGSHIKMLNLGLNLLDDNLRRPLGSFLGKVHKDFMLVLEYNRFGNKLKELIKRKFKKNVQIDLP